MIRRNVFSVSCIVTDLDDWAEALPKAATKVIAAATQSLIGDSMVITYHGCKNI